MEQRSATRNWLIAVGLLVVAGVAAYFVGAAIEHSARAREVAATRAQLQAARTQVASLQSVNQLLTADVWVYRAAVALDNRNFGMANDAVAKVVASLNAVDAAAAGLDGAPLAALKTEAAGVRISVATNLEPQRAQLIRLAEDITALSDRSAAGTHPTRRVEG
jgi:hypothetical protein